MKGRPTTTVSLPNAAKTILVEEPCEIRVQSHLVLYKSQRVKEIAIQSSEQQRLLVQESPIACQILSLQEVEHFALEGCHQNRSKLEAILRHGKNAIANWPRASAQGCTHTSYDLQVSCTFHHDPGVLLREFPASSLQTAPPPCLPGQRCRQIGLAGILQYWDESQEEGRLGHIGWDAVDCIPQTSSWDVHWILPRAQSGTFLLWAGKEVIPEEQRFWQNPGCGDGLDVSFRNFCHRVHRNALQVAHHFLQGILQDLHLLELWVGMATWNPLVWNKRRLASMPFKLHQDPLVF